MLTISPVCTMACAVVLACVGCADRSVSSVTTHPPVAETDRIPLNIRAYITQADAGYQIVCEIYNTGDSPIFVGRNKTVEYTIEGMVEGKKYNSYGRNTAGGLQSAWQCLLPLSSESTASSKPSAAMLGVTRIVDVVTISGESGSLPDSDLSLTVNVMIRVARLGPNGPYTDDRKLTFYAHIRVTG